LQEFIRWRTALRAVLSAIQKCGETVKLGRGLGIEFKTVQPEKALLLILVSRDESGSVRKFPVPLHYAYVFIAVAVIGHLR